MVFEAFHRVETDVEFGTPNGLCHLDQFVEGWLRGKDERNLWPLVKIERARNKSGNIFDECHSYHSRAIARDCCLAVLDAKHSIWLPHVRLDPGERKIIHKHTGIKVRVLELCLFDRWSPGDMGPLLRVRRIASFKS